jgi:hypothetical protein
MARNGLSEARLHEAQALSLKLEHQLTEGQHLRDELRELRNQLHLDIKNAYDALDLLKEFVAVNTNEKLRERYDEAVEKALEILRAQMEAGLRKILEKGTQLVYDRFDLIASITLGEDFDAVQSGSPPVAELIRRYIALNKGELAPVIGPEEAATFLRPGRRNDAKPL